MLLRSLKDRGVNEIPAADGMFCLEDCYFKQAFEYSTIAICLVGIDGHFMKINKAVTELLQYTESEITTFKFNDITHPDDIQIGLNFLEQLLEGRTTTARFEKRYIRKNGEIVIASVSVSVVSRQTTTPFFITQIQDITSTKQAEEELRKSREEFQGYFEMGSNGICVTSPTKGWVQVNDRLCQMLGYTKDELYKLTWVELTHPDDITTDLELFDEVVNGKRDRYDLDKRFIRKDGSTIFTALSVSCSRNADGTVNHFLASLSDISQRKLIEETQLFLLSLHRHAPGKSFFESLAKFLAEILEMDYVCIDKLHGDLRSAQTVAVYFDGEYEDNISYTLKETPCGDVVGKTICCFPDRVRFLYPNDTVLQEMNAESYLGATLYSSTGEPIGLIAIIGRRPLHNISVAESILKVASIRAAAELERLSAKDALGESEVHLQGILQSTADGILAVSNNGKIMKVNNRFGQLWDIPLSIIQSSNNQVFWEMVLNRVVEPEKFVAKVRELNSSEKEQLDIINFKDGRIVERFSAPLIMSGKVLGRVWSFRDITDRVRSEEKILSANIALQKLNSEKDKFLSIIAHDLRSPLHGFIALTDLLIKGAADLSVEEITEFGMLLNQSGSNIYNLLENLLQWARMQDSTLSCRVGRINLHDAIQENIKAVSAKSQLKGITIQAELPGSLWVCADSNMLNTVIRNLLSNAIKFTWRGGKVTVSTKLLDDSFVEVSVSDNGIGIEPDDINKLFAIDQKFSRLGTENEPSSGLGLLLCKEFIVKQGGQIRVESKKDSGSTFYFNLPQFL